VERDSERNEEAEKKKRLRVRTSTRSCSDVGAEVTAAAAAAGASSSGGAGAEPSAGSHGEEAISGLVMRTQVCGYLRNFFRLTPANIMRVRTLNLRMRASRHFSSPRKTAGI
jgi:hypothetical protein